MWRSDSPFSIRPRFEWNLIKWLVAFAASCTERKMRSSVPIIRDLTFASLSLYEELRTLPGMSFGFRQDGSLMLFATARGFSDGKRDAQLLRDNGIASQVLSTEEILQQEPSIKPTIAGGIYYPDDAHIQPAQFVESVATLAQGLGANLLPATAVVGFNRSNGRISAVQTTQGDFCPKTVVLAAGAESSNLAHMLRIDLPIQAGKGYSYSSTSPAFSPSRPLLLSEAKVAITPFGGKVRFAGTLELSGIDNTIDSARLNAIRQRSSQYFTCKLSETLHDQWSGLRPCTPDGLPVISFAPTIRNLVVASGHAMLGISLGPITGKLAGQLICDEPPDLDLSSLGLSRFD
jgi:D-amino-acid dehydrogenase